MGAVQLDVDVMAQVSQRLREAAGHVAALSPDPQGAPLPPIVAGFVEEIVAEQARLGSAVADHANGLADVLDRVAALTRGVDVLRTIFR